MVLRARLGAAFAAAVSVPVLLGTAVLVVTLPTTANARNDTRVSTARAAVEARLQAACQTVVATATTLARSTAGPEQSVERAASTPGADAAQLTGLRAAVTAGAARAGAADTALLAAVSAAPDCRDGGDGGPRAVVARVALTRRAGTAIVGTAIVGMALDPALSGSARGGLLYSLATGLHTGLTLSLPTAGAGIADPPATTLADAGLASTVVTAASAAPPGTGVVHRSGQAVAALPLAGGAMLLVSVRQPSSDLVIVLLLSLALLGLVLAVLVGLGLAGAATRPLGELVEAADRVTGGDLDSRLPVGGRDEVARLAVSFNTMTAALRRTITDLRTSRDELQRSVSQLGDTLSGTHDLDRILAVIVDTSMLSVRATAGALMLTSAAADSLYLRVGRGLEGRLPPAPDGAEQVAGRRISAHWRAADPRVPRQPPGVGARVAATGVALFGVVGPGGLEMAADEPRAQTVLATPLHSGDRVTGVLTLYDRSDGQPFDQRDAEIVRSFVAQATVAVDNVLLHQEAQRLSITDGLTGLWNYRYVVIALAREVERATRFGRQLSVLMLDLDRFKRVNDRYGHQRGDAVLTEVAARIRTVVREVDVLARYGGEELILVLPETDLHGAEYLAGRVREAIRSQPMGGPGEEPVPVTVSVGVAVYPQHGDSARSLLRAADSALYAAKAAGRDCWRVAAPAQEPSPEMDITPPSPQVPTEGIRLPS